MMRLLEITPQQQKHLEKMTRGQSKSDSIVWLRFRSGRTIASQFHQMVHTNLL